MSKKEGLEAFNAKMEFSLELLHKVLGTENTDDVVDRMASSDIFSAEELTEIKDKVQAAMIAGADDDRIKTISNLRNYLFHILD